jgi:hypothetical protein
MQQLDRGGQRHQLVGPVRAEAAGQQRNRRPQALALAREDVLKHRLHDRDV